MASNYKKEVEDKLQRAKNAATVLGSIPTSNKNKALLKISAAINANRDFIIKQNLIDIKNAKGKLQDSLIDRLTLTDKRIDDIIEGLNQVAKLQDPVGKILSKKKLSNGLIITKVSASMGVIGMIYESRPNVTVDAASLCLKAGSSVVLRGSSSAIYSNKALVKVMREALKDLIPQDSILLIENSDRNSVKLLLSARGKLDLLIPRGGADLINFVVNNAKVPVIETGAGVCHVFVDESANQKMAQDIVINSKTQRPSVCNSAETLLVHEKIAKSFLPNIAAKLHELNVTIKADAKAKKILGKLAQSAKEKDFYTEYNDLIMNVAVVKDVQAAIEHINKFGTHHTESIVSKNSRNIQLFKQRIDSTTIYSNASTRFTDGFEFGMGAEIGISTQKLHARGPMALPELTTTKFLVSGTGQIRK